MPFTRCISTSTLAIANYKEQSAHCKKTTTLSTSIKAKTSTHGEALGTDVQVVFVMSEELLNFSWTQVTKKLIGVASHTLYTYTD